MAPIPVQTLNPFLTFSAAANVICQLRVNSVKEQFMRRMRDVRIYWITDGSDRSQNAGSIM